MKQISYDEFTIRTEHHLDKLEEDDELCIVRQGTPLRLHPVSESVQLTERLQSPLPRIQRDGLCLSSAVIEARSETKP